MRSNHPSDWRKLDRDFIEDKDFVEADLNMVIKFGNDVNPAKPFGYVQRLVFLFFGDVALRNSIQASQRARLIILPSRIWLVRAHFEKGRVKDIRGKFDV